MIVLFPFGNEQPFEDWFRDLVSDLLLIESPKNFCNLMLITKLQKALPLWLLGFKFKTG